MSTGFRASGPLIYREQSTQAYCSPQNQHTISLYTDQKRTREQSAEPTTNNRYLQEKEEREGGDGEGLTM